MESDIVVFSWMGTGKDTEFLKKAAVFLQHHKINHVMLATDPQEDDTRYGVVPSEESTMSQYLFYGGMDNYRNFWLWLCHTYCREKCVYQDPQLLVWNGIYHPKADRPFLDIGEYRSLYCRPDRPTIGIIFYRDEWLWSDLAYQTALVEEIERQGMNALAVFTQGVPNPDLNAPGVDETVRTYFYDQGKPVIDVLINTIKFSLTSCKEIDQKFLEKLGVPMLQANTLLRSQEAWQKCIEGMTSMEIGISVTMPEFDGIIHAAPVAGKEYLPDSSTRYTPIQERIGLVVQKAGKWARLRYKENIEKKIAIIFHNYPATNFNIGSAAGLDSPDSIRLVLEEMAEQGYRIEQLPPDSQTLMNELVAQVTNDRRFLSESQIQKAAGKVSKEQYCRWFDTLEPETQEQLTRDWGAAPGLWGRPGQDLLLAGLCADPSLFGLLSLDKGYLAGRCRGSRRYSWFLGMASRKSGRPVPLLLP